MATLLRRTFSTTSTPWKTVCRTQHLMAPGDVSGHKQVERRNEDAEKKQRFLGEEVGSKGRCRKPERLG